MLVLDIKRFFLLFQLIDIVMSSVTLPAFVFSLTNVLFSLSLLFGIPAVHLSSSPFVHVVHVVLLC